jgi:hypothetical protein
MARDFRMTPESDEDVPRDPPEEARSPSRRGNQVELFVLALALSLGAGAVLLALLTRKHLFARQITPAESPIQVT